MGSPLLSVAEQLLRDLQRTYSETKQIPDDLLIALRFVFGPCALQALDLVDQRSVTCVSSPSGRDAFQVLGGSGRLYTCFTSCHYCPCPAFSFTALRRNESLMQTDGSPWSLALRIRGKYQLSSFNGRTNMCWDTTPIG
ncbi:zinc finger SWIM domain-containing protein 7 isoform X2 [Cyprinus carpio]|uniref:Zinc finger SWIM domain-containing protein 7 isoform X2 n=1 Tax=Cyprinus carpio TaxID=7962 RepID=A0A9R0AY81_CYPCA|nr:zinc finger SWIM domain-containing protein 7 isoform X2 [Cyprinus carpio]